MFPSRGHPDAAREEVSQETWGPREPCRHTPIAALCFPFWQAPAPTSMEVGKAVVPNGPGTEQGVGVLLPWTAASWNVCLSLAVADCVLWTSGQDVALSLLET